MTKWLWLIAANLLTTSCSQREGDGENITPTANASSPVQPAARLAKRSGPFGLAMGQSLDELTFETEEDGVPGDARVLASVPKPMSELESYAVLAYRETGVCEIRTSSPTFESDAYGNNVRPAMDSLAKLLQSKYGKYTRVDTCSDHNCGFFQQNLKSGSAAYFYEWSAKSGASLPADIAEVTVFALPGEYNNTYFRLDYISSNKKGCQAAREKVKAAAL